MLGVIRLLHVNKRRFHTVFSFSVNWCIHDGNDDDIGYFFTILEDSIFLGFFIINFLMKKDVVR